MEQIYDVAIIGGGINGCGSAADAAMRGLSVFLCEQDDLASKTSSSSSNLIHGGLRYLEHKDFKLVRKALKERQTLYNLAPHLITPLPFVLPYQQNIRPFWLIRAGLFIYDHLSLKNKLPKTQTIHRSKAPHYFDPLNESLKKGFLYYDCKTDDARLTMSNALQAQQYGAKIAPYTHLIHAEVKNNYWELSLQSKHGQYKIGCKSIINASGPWVENLSHILNIPAQKKLSLIKGSHLVIDKLYEGDYAYLLQNTDNRIIFTIPYHQFTAIGTTEINTDLTKPIQIESSEIDYLLSMVNQYFNKKITADQIKYTYSGIRPLVFDAEKAATALSRDYFCYYHEKPAPVINIYGGKITTYRQLACQAVDELKKIFPQLPNTKTEHTPLPGATFLHYDWEAYQKFAFQKYSWLEESLKQRYLLTYGTHLEKLLNQRTSMADLGAHLGNSLYQAEVDYLVQYEWAHSSEDILWRRTKLGLTIHKETRKKLDDYLVTFNQS